MKRSAEFVGQDDNNIRFLLKSEQLFNAPGVYSHETYKDRQFHKTYQMNAFLRSATFIQNFMIFLKSLIYSKHICSTLILILCLDLVDCKAESNHINK
jgi:hypothetical protein